MIADFRGEALVILGILVYLFVIVMIVDVIKNGHLNRNLKVAWIIAICLLAVTVMLAPFGALVYFFKKRSYESAQLINSPHN